MARAPAVLGRREADGIRHRPRRLAACRLRTGIQQAGRQGADHQVAGLLAAGRRAEGPARGQLAGSVAGRLLADLTGLAVVPDRAVAAPPAAVLRTVLEPVQGRAIGRPRIAVRRDVLLRRGLVPTQPGVAAGAQARIAQDVPRPIVRTVVNTQTGRTAGSRRTARRAGPPGPGPRTVRQPGRRSPAPGKRRVPPEASVRLKVRVQLRTRVPGKDRALRRDLAVHRDLAAHRAHAGPALGARGRVPAVQVADTGTARRAAEVSVRDARRRLIAVVCGITPKEQALSLAGPARPGRAPTGPAPAIPAPVGLAPVGPAPVGPAPVGRVRGGPAQVGPARDGPVRVGRVREGPKVAGRTRAAPIPAAQIPAAQIPAIADPAVPAVLTPGALTLGVPTPAAPDRPVRKAAARRYLTR